MEIFNSIYQGITKRIDKHEPSVNKDDFFLLKTGTYTFILVLLIFGTINLFEGNMILVFLNFGTVLIVLGHLLWYLRTYKYELISTLITAFLTIWLTALLVITEAEYILFLFTLLPLVSILFLKKKMGSKITGLALLILLLLLFIPITSLNQIILLRSKFIFLFVFILIFIISDFFKIIYTCSINKLENARKEAIEANITKDNFISKKSHQLRTSLNNIVVLGKMINDLNPTKNQKELLDTLIASTNNLVDIVNNIVQLPGIDISYKERKKIKFDLFSTLSNIIDSFPSETKKNVVFHVNDFKNFNREIIGDPVLVKQLLLNILENIIPFESGKKPQITISVTNQKETSDNIVLVFSIEINQIITYKDITDNKLLDDKQNDQLIDLSISEKLLKTLGRRLEYKKLKEKSRFTFSLEFIKVVYKEAPTVRKEKVNLIDSNILIVEDNEINQQIMKLSLIKLVKNVDVAENGKMALDMFGLNRYNLILMDIQMPIMNGITATKKIREIEKSTNTHIPIIAITANAMLGDKETCLSAGIDDYLSKPYQMEDLISKMNNLLS
ncbi:MAG: response regulator [Bacteroidetes bacterium]|nr:response regulator [Bacteroidota bacterium]